MTKEIELTYGQIAIIDDEDYELISKFKWSAARSWKLKTGFTKFYARAYTGQKNSKTFMHRIITGCKTGDGLEVDHINGNTLDNRKSNLRICNRKENVRNSNSGKSNKFGYKGVCKERHTYSAKIHYEGKDIRISGNFKTPEEAAKAYDKKALELFGEFAKTNF